MKFTWCFFGVSVSALSQSRSTDVLRAGSAKLRSIPARPTAGGPVVQSWKDVMCFAQDFARCKFGAQNPVVS